MNKKDKLYYIEDEVESTYIEDPRRWSDYRNSIENHRLSLIKSYKIGHCFDIHANDVIIDIGANVGFFTSYCASKGAVVISIEPDTNIFPVLNKNIALLLNNKRVELYNMAISNSNE